MAQAGPLSVHTGGTEVPVPKDFRWPGGKRIAVIFRVASRRGRTTLARHHPMGNPLKPGFPT